MSSKTHKGVLIVSLSFSKVLFVIFWFLGEKIEPYLTHDGNLEAFLF